VGRCGVKPLSLGSVSQEKERPQAEHSPSGSESTEMMDAHRHHTAVAGQPLLKQTAAASPWLVPVPAYSPETDALPISAAAEPVVICSRAGSRYDLFVKPLLDRIGAGTILLLLLPILAAVALLVIVTLGRPLLYRQQRVGRHNEGFEMLKFRTMEPDRRRRRLSVAPPGDRRRRHKSSNDPRHTPVGRFLRRTSLDELPQLWNVLRGDMSLVGPRPELEDLVAGYAPWQHQRHQVKPGITGLWQVTDRQLSAGDMHLHTATDLAYIEQLSLRTDLRILLRTPTALVKGQ
jgi:lipopolysaccharide/colanic/teichoic acid biosynthesis glycosyltransferase